MHIQYICISMNSVVNHTEKNKIKTRKFENYIIILVEKSISQ